MFHLQIGQAIRRGRQHTLTCLLAWQVLPSPSTAAHVIISVCFKRFLQPQHLSTVSSEFHRLQTHFKSIFFVKQPIYREIKIGVIQIQLKLVIWKFLLENDMPISNWICKYANHSCHFPTNDMEIKCLIYHLLIASVVKTIFNFLVDTSNVFISTAYFLIEKLIKRVKAYIHTYLIGQHELFPQQFLGPKRPGNDFEKTELTLLASWLSDLETDFLGEISDTSDGSMIQWIQNNKKSTPIFDFINSSMKSYCL